MSENVLKLRIVTPEKITYESDDVSFVTIPTTEGEITVLPHHIPIVSTIKVGQIKISKKGELYGCAISSGILEVQGGSTVVVLAERSEMAHLIDIQRAEDAHKRALEVKNRISEDDDIDNARINALIDKELNRVRVGNKWKI